MTEARRALSVLRLPSSLLALSLLAGVAAGPAVADPGGWAAVILEERRRGQAMPLVSRYDPGLELAHAYAIQRELVREALRERGIGGYKAGFTSAPAREEFGLEGPVMGVLFADGRVGDGIDLDLSAFRRLVVELEIGFVLRSRITREMRTVSDLKTYVSHAMPVIELPDLDYEDVGALSGLDVVATNVASGLYLAGAPFRVTDLAEVNAISVRLFRDGLLVDEGHAANALGNQLEALRWLVNAALEHGWPLEPGHVLMTGTLGKLNPGMAGSYVADYGRSEVRFTVRGTGSSQPR